jgi:hypothetical protein
MSDLNRFFEEEQERTRSGASGVVGSIGLWLLHFVMFSFAFYSGAHGINAALQYAGSTNAGKVAQIVGILVIETVLIGLYLGFLNGKITGPAQTIAAGVTYLLGFTLACLGIIADSRLNSGVPLSPELEFYLLWVLPIAPAIMALGALLVHILAPNTLRYRKQDQQSRELEDTAFTARLAIERARAEEEISKRGLQVMSRKAVLRELENIYSSPEFREAIKRTAIERAPELFSEAGIMIEHTMIPEETGRRPYRAPSPEAHSNGREPAPLSRGG